MMSRRLISAAGLSLMCLVGMPRSTVAQFGVGAGGRRANGGTTFQELNEQAKQQMQQQGGAGGGLAGMDAMWKDAMQAFEQDPEMMKKMEEAVKAMSDMTPEQLQQQLEDAMKLMTDGDMLQQMFDSMNSEELISYLEQTGVVPPEEIAKMKTDPEYLQQKLAESMEQMKELMSNPELMKGATQMMEGVQDLVKNPSALDEMMASMMAGFSDEQIEEARLQILNNPELAAGMFDTDDMKAILNDPQKWKESVKEGTGLLGAGAAAQTPDAGEL